MIAVLSLALSCVTLLCLLGVLLLNRRRVELAYARGYSEAGAVLFGVVAAELGHASPVVDRMLDRYGASAPRV
jgi:hypothetical protein